MEGSQFVQRYHVQAFPHISMIDPRTGRLLWKKEGWTQQQHPLTAEAFAEIAMDFCSRNSLDRPPPITAAPPRLGSGDGAPSMHQTGKHHPDDDDNHQQHNNNNNITNNNVHHMTEEEQLMAAVRASMEEQAASETNRRNGARPGSTSDKDDDGDDEVQVVDLPTATTNATATTSAASSSSSSAWFQALCDTPVPVWDDATTTGSVGGPARISFRMPNGSRVVRTFAGTDPVQMMYAFVAVCPVVEVVVILFLFLFFPSSCTGSHILGWRVGFWVAGFACFACFLFEGQRSVAGCRTKGVGCAICASFRHVSAVFYCTHGLAPTHSHTHIYTHPPIHDMISFAFGNFWCFVNMG